MLVKVNQPRADSDGKHNQMSIMVERSLSVDLVGGEVFVLV